jgi:hypothetical protein
MLNDVIEQLMSEVSPFPDYPDEIPRWGLPIHVVTITICAAIK